MDTTSLPRRVPWPVYPLSLFGGYTTAFGWIFFGGGLFITTPMLMRIQDWLTLIMLIFPGVGLVLILIKLIPGLRALRLMRHGLPAVGTLVAIKETYYSREDGSPFCRLTFRFTTAEGKPYKTIYSTDELKPAWQIFNNQMNSVTYDPAKAKRMAVIVSIIRKFMPAMIKQSFDDSLAVAQAAAPPAESELQETVLYLPANPAVAALPLSFGTGIAVDDRGNIRGSAILGILSAILPALVIVSESAWIYLLIRQE